MPTSKNKKSEVLFQKLGNTWYIFTEVNNEMVYSALPEGMDPRTTRMELFSVIEDHMEKVGKSYKKLPEAVA